MQVCAREYKKLPWFPTMECRETVSVKTPMASSEKKDTEAQSPQALLKAMRHLCSPCQCRGERFFFVFLGVFSGSGKAEFHILSLSFNVILETQYNCDVESFWEKKHMGTIFV